MTRNQYMLQLNKADGVSKQLYFGCFTRNDEGLQQALLKQRAAREFFANEAAFCAAEGNAGARPINDTC